MLEKCLASLEDAKYAFTFASGVGSIATMIYLLKTGDRVLLMVSRLVQDSSADVHARTHLRLVQGSNIQWNIHLLHQIRLAHGHPHHSGRYD